MTKVGLSANLGGLVFKACLLYYLGGPSAKVCSSAKFYVLVFKASLLDYGGYPSAKVCSSAQLCVLVFKASMLYSLWGCPLAKDALSNKYEYTSKLLLNIFLCNCLQEMHSHSGGSIRQSSFVCQVWYSGIQGIYSQFTGGSIGQSRFVCQLWCSSIQGIYSQFTGGVH